MLNKKCSESIEHQAGL